MRNYEACDICGKVPKVHIGGGKDNLPDRSLCCNCYNREMADMYAVEMPDNVPERLTFNDKNGKPRDFEIEFMIFGTGKSLIATEIGKLKRRADVWGILDDDFDDMLALLKKRIKKALSVNYMNPDRSIKDGKLVGYIDYDSEKDDYVIFIDGKPFSWDELGRNVSTYEGWKIKIEFGSISDDLD